jgi:membrane-associated phospholipid phosphatase
MNQRGAKVLLNCILYAAAQTLCAACMAQTSDQPVLQSPPQTTDVNASTGDLDEPEKKEPKDSTVDYTNALGTAFLKNLLSDQKAIWSSPAHLRWADGTWLFPLAAVTAGMFATDRAVPPALSTDQNKLHRYVSISNYGLYSMIGAGGGLYLWSKISHDDHQRETGILAGEAAIDALAVDTGLKYAFGRARPYQEQGLGNFFQGGTSFPSDHSAVAWSIASVLAHEYPGTLTQIAAYGLATAVSASRVVGKQHFPSDVLVGGAIGWLIGRQVYRAHHDPELGGGGWDSLSGSDEMEDRRARQRMGSTFVPLDSWVYPAMERLSALGYVTTGMMGMKPWTRIECAVLTEEAGEALQQDPNSMEDAAKLQLRLEQEFAYEAGLLSGGRNITASVESVYARAVSISGPALTDGYHFGQTVAYDFGRPFERGTNGQAGGSFSAAAGPMAIYIRAEYQHAPSAPTLSTSVVNFISQADGGVAIGDPAIPISRIPAGPFRDTNRLELLDAYATVNLSNWQIVLGKQSLSWAPGNDSMMWNDNIDPVNMVRLVNPEPVYLPGFLKHLGPFRIDQFFGRLGGHPYVPRPFIYGQKFNFKPFSFMELGFGRRTTLGGTGSSGINVLNGRDLLSSFFGIATGGVPGNFYSQSVAGDTESEMDWTFYVPKTRNYIVLYGDAYAEDDILPIQQPKRNPWHPGIYITRIPGIPKLDFHVEGVSTEQNGLVPQVGGGNHGLATYWNQNYQDGNTNYGFLNGNTVGREGRAIQSWITYWISPADTLQISYKHSSINADYIPGGAAWQDYGVRNELTLQRGFYVKTQLQYEHISRYPLLFKGPRQNFTAILEVGFYPRKKVRQGSAVD